MGVVAWKKPSEPFLLHHELNSPKVQSFPSSFHLPSLCCEHWRRTHQPSRAGKQEEDITHKMVGLKEVLVVALLCSCMPCWACFGGSDAPEGSFSDFCQICVDMVTKANGMEVMDSEEYLRHHTKLNLEGEERDLFRQLVSEYTYIRKWTKNKNDPETICSKFVLC